VIGRKKVWCLSYADDIVCLAKSEREMKEMMRIAKKFFEKRRLIVSVEKSKIVVFKKKGQSRKTSAI